jgi:hypothetical protein
MAKVQGTLPYDLDNLIGGGARVLMSDDATALPAVPAKLQDIIDCKTPYAPKTGWLDLGATTDGSSYSRDMDESGWEIEQVNAAVFNEVTEVTRQFSITMGEVIADNVKIMENAAGITTIAAATGGVAQKGVKFGTFVDRITRRMAIIGQRKTKSGVVDEGGTAPTVKRGRFVGVCLYSVQVAAEGSETSFAKGEITGVPLTVQGYPEGGQAQGQEFGIWLFEDAGTVTP